MTRHLERLSLYLLLVVIALRPLIGESYHSSRTGISAALTAISDPQPATTLAIDAVIILAAVCWLFARALARAKSYRRCGIEWGALLVTLAGIVSCCAAGNKRAAVNATVDWLCLPLLTIVLVQVLRHRWQVRLTLCVILASAAAQAGECFNQVFDTFPETERMYVQNKAAFWAAAGVEFDAPQVALYERRLHGREATGFGAHSNVTGAFLMMTGLAALALTWSRWRSPRVPLRRVLAVGALLLGGAIFAAADYTRSKGALVAGTIALVLWALRVIFGYWFEANRRKALLIGWGLVVLAALGTVGHGLTRGGLPGSSLDFRWQYWTTSWRLFAGHWATGVGRENFGLHYLEHKTIESPEEITNPHNFLVSAATEWGVLGAIGVAVMLIGGSVAATRWSPRRENDPAERGGSPLAWGVAVGAVAFSIRVFLLGSDQTAYLLYATAVPLIVWATAYVVCCADSNRLSSYSGTSLRQLAAGLNFGLLAFLLQDVINFAMFVPGAATTFFALLGVSIGDWGLEVGDHTGALSWRSKGGGRSVTRWLLPVGGVVVLVAYTFLVLSPVARAGKAIATARAWADRVVRGPYEIQPAYAAYQAAAEADPLDPTPRAEAAAFLIGYAETTPRPAEALTRAFELIEAAIERNPHSTPLHRQKLHMCQRAFGLTLGQHYLQAAVAPARRVVELYPQSPNAQADLGTALLDAGRDSGDASLLSQAVTHLTRALELDDARPGWEKLRRMPTRRREQIQARINEASGLLGATR